LIKHFTKAFDAFPNTGLSKVASGNLPLIANLGVAYFNDNIKN
jgi:hypothetical protein